MHKLRHGCLSLALAAPACCVAASMPVRTPRGEVEIGAIAVGDRVWSIDVATGERVEATVLQVRRATRECMALRWQGGALICTPDHPIYAPDTGDYRPASSWAPGRGLLLAAGEGARVVAVTAVEVYAGVHEVIDLTLDVEPHNFVAAGIVVHNKSPVDDSPVGGGSGIFTVTEPWPVVELGPGEWRSFRVRACHHGDQNEFVVANFEVEAIAKVASPDGVPLAVAVSVDGAWDSTDVSGPVPFDDQIEVEGFALNGCDDGVVLRFDRDDDGAGGVVAVSWQFEVGVDRAEVGATQASDIEVTIEPQQ